MTYREGKFFSTPADTWMGALVGNAGLVPALQEESPVDHEMGDGGLPTESGGKSTEATEEPSMAAPRLILVPDTPTNSGGQARPPIMEDWGNTPDSFDQN